MSDVRAVQETNTAGVTAHGLLLGGAEVEKTIWSSPAGKKLLAPRLVKLIPAHKIYVEPFAGSAALFFQKPPSEIEVLGDADPEIASALRALSTLTSGELDELEEKSWIGRRTLYEGLQKSHPKSKVEKLYRFLYLSHFSYGKLRGRGYDPNADGVEARTIKRIKKFRERLKGVTVRSAHYVDVVKEFDGPDTFFFFDPPYAGYDVAVGEKDFNEDEFLKVLDGIKGRFLATYGSRSELDTSGFYVRRIRQPRRAAHFAGSSQTLPHLLIANYKIAAKALGPYELDDIQGAVEVSEDTAVLLDQVSVLTKALAAEVDDPSIAALDRELSSLEAVGFERATTLAGVILPFGERLAAALKNLRPDVPKAFETARTVLAKLAMPNEQGGTGELVSTALGKQIPLLKTDEERYVLGIVLEPETVDAQNDIYSATEVREAAHRFMEAYRNVGLMHQGIVNSKVKILESYLAPVDFELGGVRVKKGTWLLAVHILDDELWAQVKSGELTGYSIGGSAQRHPESDKRVT